VLVILLISHDIYLTVAVAVGILWLIKRSGRATVTATADELSQQPDRYR
jgi:hypothetical protein